MYTQWDITLSVKKKRHYDIYKQIDGTGENYFE